MNNAFYFTLKFLLIIKIFEFLSWLFDHVEKLLDYKDKINFKISDVAAWKTSNCNAHPISQEVKAIRKWNLVSW